MGTTFGNRQAADSSMSSLGDEPINILIVDDEPKNLTVLETILDTPTYRLVRAESAEQALLALLDQEFALLILDIHMPGLTGFELAQLIKGRKKNSSVPIIFLTAYYSDDQHMLAGYDTGAVDYLHKPVNAAVLRTKVAVFAELHRKRCDLQSANRDLLAEVSLRRRAEEQVRELNASLEQRITERTISLRLSEERLRAIYDGTVEFMGLLTPDGTVLDANRALLEFAGIRLKDVSGLLLWETVWLQSTPGAPEVVRQAVMRAAAGSIVRFETPIITLSGEVRIFDVSLRPVRDDSGEVVLIVPAGLDVTERKQAEQALRESERRFREMIDVLPAAIFTTDAQGFLTHFNPASVELSGRAPKLGTDRWCVSSKLYKADGTPMPLEDSPLAIALKGGPLIRGTEAVIERLDGTRLWTTSYPTPMRDAEGKIVGGINIMIDITDRHRAEEHVLLLMNEISHRSKNMLSIVLAIVRQTVAATPEEFKERFMRRIEALATHHDLLVNSQWRSIDLSTLIRAQLAHFEDLFRKRILFDGAQLNLSPAAAQSISMAVHEMATNAIKYGALSGQTGHVEIAWEVESGDADECRFTISWIERDGPPIIAPTRLGFGTKVIKDMIELGFDGEVKLDYEPSGLSWRLVCPVTKILETDGFGRRDG